MPCDERRVALVFHFDQCDTRSVHFEHRTCMRDIVAVSVGDHIPKEIDL